MASVVGLLVAIVLLAFDVRWPVAALLGAAFAVVLGWSVGGPGGRRERRRDGDLPLELAVLDVPDVTYGAAQGADVTATDFASEGGTFGGGGASGSWADGGDD